MTNFFGYTFSTYLFLLAPLAYATTDPVQHLFNRGDSLFQAGNYLEAYKAYEILHMKGYTTQGRLLRMAYIQEGLKSYPKALTHLVDYYVQTYDAEVWHKILTLSEEHKVVESYQHTSLPMLAWLLSYESEILIFLSGSSLFLIIYLWRKTPSRTWLSVLVITGSLLIGMLHKNQWLPKHVVVMEVGAHLRRSASAASPQVSAFTLPQGTLCKVIQKGPVWTKLQVYHYEGYIRTQKLLSTAHFM